MTFIVTCGMKYIMYFKSSTVRPVKFKSEWAFSINILLAVFTYPDRD